MINNQWLTNKKKEKYVPVLKITVGIFNINSPDDAIHFNSIIKITRGIFNIYTGNENIHAHDSVILENKNG